MTDTDTRQNHLPDKSAVNMHNYRRDVEDWQNATEPFRFGVGEGSHINRVPVAVKVIIQTTVSDKIQTTVLTSGCSSEQLA